ncbi:hypothetical protein NQ318_012491 [Aromia moschata]|uniref:Transposase n=1 Tax=Aromia moschata TaxID=1265417 RepID=A0AAV8XYI3_9CUCU|nr:hypothetical protein NQ318_012491 [Aromia moschata]
MTIDNAGCSLTGLRIVWKRTPMLVEKSSLVTRRIFGCPQNDGLNTNAGRSCSPISRKISGVAADISRYQHVRQLKKDPPNKLSDDQKLDVTLILEDENPHTSNRQTVSALNNSHSSILRVLTENQMHPYKLVPSNELAENDFDRQILFCEQIMQMIEDNNLQIENVLFSDESTFTLHDHVNRQNCRYLSRENPHWMWGLHTQKPENVNVWAGIIGENIIGPSSLTAI